MLEHPIDLELRKWLAGHVENQTEISTGIGRSASWLHKYVNGDGQATIDDLVRIAGLLFGLNLPVLSESERKLLKACQGLDDADQVDVLAYAEHRGRLARREQSKESSEQSARSRRAIVRKARA